MASVGPAEHVSATPIGCMPTGCLRDKGPSDNAPAAR